MLVTHGGSTLVTHAGSTLVMHGGSTLVTHGGSTLVMHGGSILFVMHTDLSAAQLGMIWKQFTENPPGIVPGSM